MRISPLTPASFALLIGSRLGLVSSVGSGFAGTDLTHFIESLPPREEESTHFLIPDSRSDFAVPGFSSPIFPYHQQALDAGEHDPSFTQHELDSSIQPAVYGSTSHITVPPSHWQTSYTPNRYVGPMPYDHGPTFDVLHSQNVPQHVTHPAFLESQLWSQTSFPEVDLPATAPLLEQGAHEQHQELAVSQGTDTYAASDPASKAKRRRRNGAPWSEEQKARWIRQRLSYSKQEPQYLRLLPYVFPDLPWLKRAKMQVWERPSLQQHIGSHAFKDQFTWVKLEDVPRLRKVLRKRSPAVRPSRILPSVSVSSAELVNKLEDQGPHSVYLTAHGYRGRYRDGKVAGTPLESNPYYGVWALPSNPAKDNFMFFLGMGYLDPALTSSPVKVLTEDALRSERKSASLQ